MQGLRCPQCSSPTVTGQRFCGRCGYALNIDCPRCGTFISAGDKFCENCGASVGEGLTLQPGTIQQNWSHAQAPYTQRQPFPPPQPSYATPPLYQPQAVVLPLPKGKFRIAAVLILIASILLIVSPSLVWFKAYFLSAKGSDLGDVSSLLGLIGTSLYARGEYFIVLGVVALIMVIISFFVLKGRKLIAAIIGIAATICILLGIEATVKLLDEATSMGEGLFLMFGSSLLMFIASFKLP